MVSGEMGVSTLPGPGERFSEVPQAATPAPHPPADPLAPRDSAMEEVRLAVEADRMRFDEAMSQNRELLALQREHYVEMLEIQRLETEKMTGLLELFGAVDLALEPPSTMEPLLVPALEDE